MSNFTTELAADRRLSHHLRSTWGRRDLVEGSLSNYSPMDLQRMNLQWMRHHLGLSLGDMAQQLLGDDEHQAELKWERYEEGLSRLPLGVMQKMCAMMGLSVSIFFEPRLTLVELHGLLDAMPSHCFDEVRQFLLSKAAEHHPLNSVR